MLKDLQMFYLKVSLPILTKEEMVKLNVKKILDCCLTTLLLIAIAGGAFVLGKVYYSPEVPYQTVVSSIDSSVHYSAEIEKDGKKYYVGCSGIVLENTSGFSVVATAGHCIIDNGNILVEGIPAEKVIKHKTRDLALIILKSYIPYKRAVNKPAKPHLIFGTIYHVGFPSEKILYSQGQTLIQSYEKDVGIIKFVKGCSGGGVFNKDGELVGIAVQTNGNFGIYESTRALVNFLAEQDIQSLYKEYTKQEEKKQ